MTRLHCQTPGCRRTRKEANFSEWVCQKCYVWVPPATRREHVEAKKALRMIARRNAPYEQREAAWVRADAAWTALKTAARGGLPDDDVLRQMGIV
jgi:hypothetical protein